MKSLKQIYKLIFPFSYVKYLIEELDDGDSVLDLGCGNDSKLGLINFKGKKIGIELYEPYIKESKKKGIHDKYIKEDVLKLKLKSKSFDAVIALDLIEHLEKKDGVKLLKNMEKWAKKKVIIYTTNGFVPQFSHDDNTLQEHLSGWKVKDFEDKKYKVIGINGLKYLRKRRAEIRFRPKFVWRIISDITQKITYYKSNQAFQLFAVKTLNEN